MVKPLSKPSFSQSTRRMRTHMLWKVDTHMPRAPGPTSLLKRSRISAAALLVNVIARISQGCTPLSASICAMRYVSTRVLPEPAPASTSRGPSMHSTASRCAGFKESISMPVIYPPIHLWSECIQTASRLQTRLPRSNSPKLARKPLHVAFGSCGTAPESSSEDARRVRHICLLQTYGNIPIVSNAK